METRVITLGHMELVVLQDILQGEQGTVDPSTTLIHEFF